MDAEHGEKHFSIRGRWLAMSVRGKMMLFLSLVIAMVMSITLFSVCLMNVYLRDFNVVLGDSYAVNGVLSSFEHEAAAFKQYASYRTTELELDYTLARQGTAHSLTGLRYEFSEMDIDRYLLTQSILVAYGSYKRQCDLVLRIPDENDNYIPQYYYALKIEEYIIGYTKDLLQITLAQGNDTYHHKERIFRILPMIGVFFACLVVGAAVVLWSITVRHIINPMVKLARSSKEIAAGCFDTPDVIVTNRDEIGELVQTFNKMKHSMAHSITTLQEKNEMESRLHTEEVQRINAEKMLKTAQMSLLQSQINPHFLFNTLNIISRMAKVEEAVSTGELIQCLANLFRYNLQTASARVSLTRELNIINDYIYIQHKRFGSRIGFEIDCRVDADDMQIPTFTLQPLVENAVIHGVSPKEEGGRIRLRIREKKGYVVITVTDSGQGIPADRLAKLMAEGTSHKGHLSGIGLNNVRTRVETLYPGSTFRIFSGVGFGTCVKILLPPDWQAKDNETEES